MSFIKDKIILDVMLVDHSEAEVAVHCDDEFGECHGLILQ